MDNDDTEVCGYIHNVSPIKKSTKTSYFDLQLQTKSELLRAVCFAPKRRGEFESKSKAVSPVKLKRFRLDETNSTKTILLSREAELIDTTIDFESVPIPPTNNIASLTGAHLNQLIDITATVSQLSTIKTMDTRLGEKDKVECYLADPTSAIKLKAWGDHAHEINERKTYTFKNLRVVKEYNSSSLALATSVHCCKITE
ncbi:uncharacterized protein LOC116604604 [Nematostella vectensis]|uniref:uncharacterized protein LOC116604604 n=1 Tax=Nematostella vectensis TaxID=45351 RepID=UPI0020778F55|nr:uncharacterized protein LOC116604604 [Nematostella vectensis]